MHELGGPHAVDAAVIAAETHEHRRPDHWDSIFYTKSANESEARARAQTLNLEGVLGHVTQPMLVIHGAKDRLFPPAQAERIARETRNATLVMYPDGNHVCNNIAYKYRPLMADWLAEQLGD
ncbi:MAG TPA: alpha/beta fold hydrolase [Candidatus Dormibacteraeota bacterium]